MGLLLAYLFLVRCPPLKEGISPRSIVNLRRLYVLYLGFRPLFFFDNNKHLQYVKSFLCLPIALALLVTSLANATTDNSQNTTAQPPITMLLNKPNYLDKCLTALSKELVIDLHNFLEDLAWLERDDGENNSIEKRIFFDQRHYHKYYDLYHMLSLRYYKGQSITNFVKCIIYNEPVKVISRPLMTAMRKLCEDYKNSQGITIGHMLAEVEKQKHTDEDINAFLRYKANSIEAQYKALYPDEDTGTKKHRANSSTDSSNKKSEESWFSRCIQNAVNHTNRMVKNVSSLAYSVMYTAPFSALVMSPVGAVYHDMFTCDNNNRILQSYVCDNTNDCGDASDERVSLCCLEGREWTADLGNFSRRSCWDKDNTVMLLFICGDDMQTIVYKDLCDTNIDCLNGNDERASRCCKGGEKGVNIYASSCVSKNDPSLTIFVCTDMSTLNYHWVCDYKAHCPDASDENVRTCCERGALGVNATDSSCFKKGYPDVKLFICDEQITLALDRLCDGYNDCKDGSDEIWSCPVASTTFTDSTFTDSNFTDSNFTDSNFTDSNFTDSNFTEASVLGAGAGAVACAVYVSVMLVKYRDKKNADGTLAWLFSPITEPVRYLREHCGYNPLPSQDVNQGL